MKTTKKVIDGLGGFCYHHDEGGGCEFFLSEGKVLLGPAEIPKDVKTLIYRLLDRAYEMGKQDGKRSAQETIRKALGME